MERLRIGKMEIPKDWTPAQTAARVLKNRAGQRNSDFNRKLIYPRTYY